MRRRRVPREVSDFDYLGRTSVGASIGTDKRHTYGCEILAPSISEHWRITIPHKVHEQACDLGAAAHLSDDSERLLVQWSGVGMGHRPTVEKAPNDWPVSQDLHAGVSIIL